MRGSEAEDVYIYFKALLKKQVRWNCQFRRVANNRFYLLLIAWNGLWEKRQKENRYVPGRQPIIESRSRVR